MKILQVNCVYKKGSTGKIISDIHSCLKRNGFDSVICYGRGALITESDVYKFCTEFESKVYHFLNRLGWLMYGVCPIATHRLIKIIKKEKPDVVHLHCINGYCVDIYKLLEFLADSNIKTIVTHHAEFLYTGSCGHAYDCTKFYQESGCTNCETLKEATGTDKLDRTNKAWRLMKQSFELFKNENILFTAVSPWVAERSTLSPICNKFKCEVVLNGLDTTIFRLSADEAIKSIKSRVPHPERKLIVHVAASFTTDKNNIKGGYYIVKLAEMMPQYQFVVASTYLGNVEGLPNNVFIWGRTDGQKQLAALYSAADVTVIASKRETFSMIVAESLCCGTPVVGFKAGGPESIGLDEYTRFVEYGNIEQLKDSVELFLMTNWDNLTISNEAVKVYSREIMSGEYLKVYNNLVYGKN